MAQRSYDSGVTPQPASSWARAYSDLSGEMGLDSSFVKLHNDIQGRSKLLDKPVRVKVKAWLGKLSEETPNYVYKKNRNAYARLLLEQLRSGRLEEPFDAMPPGSPLPTLAKSLTYPYSRTRSPSRRRDLTPSQELDEYMRGHGVSPPSRPHAHTTPSPRPFPQGHFDPATCSSRPVPSTHQPAASRWQGSSALELEAQLGASREREAELEWRLVQVEEQLRLQGQLLAKTMAAPLVAAPVQPHPGGSVRSMPSATTTSHYDEREIREVLDQAEWAVSAHKSRQQQSSAQAPLPAWPGDHESWGGACPVGSGPGSKHSLAGEGEEAECLARFGQQTDVLRRQLGSAQPHGAGWREGAATLDVLQTDWLLPPLQQVGLAGQQRPGSAGSDNTGSERHALRSPIGSEVRHTLKSAAAAAAAAGAAASARGAAGRHSSVGGKSGGAAPDRPWSAATAASRLSALSLLPRGSTAAMFADVAGLRNRLVQSLSHMGSPVVDVASLSGASSPGMPRLIGLTLDSPSDVHPRGCRSLSPLTSTDVAASVCASLGDA